LLIPVMRDGAPINPQPSLKEIQDYAKHQLSRLPAQFKKFTGAAEYPVRYSDRLERRRMELLEEFEGKRS
jgi:hypothetical protein